ncbi:MAG: cellulase family glycosylhydrolase [Phycisphaerae bacterium]|nr:cellulase family glycosylhydrolase [Phycisphaerae bacterium]
MSDAVAARDAQKAVLLAGRYFGTDGPNDAGAAKLAIEKRLDHPLNDLNESRYDRLGWIDHPELVDSDIGRWGIRINPVSGPTKIVGPKGWLFSTDQNDDGVRELRYTIGYNIENQWPQLKVGDGWQADSRFASFKGTGWYRARLHVPAEWAPNPVRLSLRAGGLVRGWINDREITHGAQNRGESWVYAIEGDKVNFGGENFFAFRIEADGARRGILGGLELTCPSIEGGGGAGATVDMMATPLSPCVVLTARAGQLNVQYEAGSARLIVPSADGMRVVEDGRYEASSEGRLEANWALLWLEAKETGGPLRPVLLVFANPPKGILVEAKGARIELGKADDRVIAVRPWVNGVPALSDREAIMKSAAFWRRAALAVPVEYMNLTTVARPGEDYADISIRRIPRGPVLEQTYIYEYLETADAWGTKPLKVAPLPALCAYAAERSFRGLEAPAACEAAQDGGLLAGYRAVTGSDRLSYRYPIEPYPRLTGFTSWMFSGVDAGVPGNQRELELIAWIGANSYRPQHNWSDELPPQGFFAADEKRTRVEITADYCNAVGVNYMNNIDQTLGLNHKMVKEDYDNFIPKVYVHYEKIARQLGDRPFWAAAYDLINEPFDHKAAKYNPAMRELTRRVRAIDERHLCYIEPCQAWGAIQNLPLVEPTGDPLTVYSFHDYNFRLFKPADRWPTMEADIRNIHRMWLPAYRYMIDHGVCMHCGEFGGFDPSTNQTLSQTTLMNDFLRVFDQFGMHSHYYSGRELFQRQADGSLKPSNVVTCYRAYFRGSDANRYYRMWPGHPVVR